MKKMLITSLLPMVMLTGCADMNSKFDCPMKPGVRCESLDQVNAQVDSGEIGHNGTQLRTDQSSIQRSAQQMKWMESPSYADFSKRKPLRYGETVQRVWIAPFEDTSGNYHQESNVYTIVKPGHWIGYPVKATNDEE